MGSHLLRGVTSQPVSHGERRCRLLSPRVVQTTSLGANERPDLVPLLQPRLTPSAPSESLTPRSMASLPSALPLHVSGQECPSPLLFRSQCGVTASRAEGLVTPALPLITRFSPCHWSQNTGLHRHFQSSPHRYHAASVPKMRMGGRKVSLEC